MTAGTSRYVSVDGISTCKNLHQGFFLWIVAWHFAVLQSEPKVTVHLHFKQWNFLVLSISVHKLAQQTGISYGSTQSAEEASLEDNVCVCWKKGAELSMFNVADGLEMELLPKERIFWISHFLLMRRCFIYPVTSTAAFSQGLICMTSRIH
jgi:hypothetical protein